MGRAPGTAERIGGARRRAAVAFGAFAAGLALARAWGVGPSWTWFAASLTLVGIAALARGVPTRAALAGAMIALGAGWWTLRLVERPGDDLAVLAGTGPRGGAIVTVEGLVLTPPRKRPGATGLFERFIVEGPSHSFELEVLRAEAEGGPRVVSGRVWVRAAGESPPGVRAGEVARVTGVFEPIGPAENPGEDDPRLSAAQRGFVGTVRAGGAELITRAAEPAGWWVRARGAAIGVREAVRARARAVVERAAGSEEDSRALVLGLLLGDYDPSAEDLRGAFARQGLAHALSISGFHLAVMAWVMLTLLRLTGDRGRVEPAVVAVLVLGYMMIVPASSPIVRSGAMVLLLLASESLGRRYDRLTVLAWIGVGLLVWRPLDLWSLGFQLSLGLTGVLLWLGGRFGAAMWGERLKGLSAPRELPLLTVLRSHLQTSVSAAVLCWAVSLPAVVYHTGQVSPLGVVASIVVMPLLVLVLWAGYLALLAGMAVPAAAGWAGGVVQALAWSAAWCVRGLDGLPGSSVAVPPVSAAWAWGATALAVAWARWGARRHAVWWALAAVAITAWPAIEWSRGGGLRPGVAARIDTLAVGDGTCHVIRSGEEALLWDCARMRPGGIRPAVVRSLRALGVHRTPTLVMSHPDLDHFGGLEAAVDGLGVRSVLAPGRFIEQARTQPRGAAAVALEFLRARGVEVRVVAAGDTMRLGGATVTFLSPPAGADWPLDNDHSLCAAVSVKDDAGTVRTMLMTGDVEDRAIERLAGMGLRPQVLELPHHGSARGASIDWVGAMAPAVVIQSTGPSRAGDARWDGVRAGRAWLCTARVGAAWAEIGRDGSVRAGGLRSDEAYGGQGPPPTTFTSER